MLNKTSVTFKAELCFPIVGLPHRFPLKHLFFLWETLATIISRGGFWKSESQGKKIWRNKLCNKFLECIKMILRK